METREDQIKNMGDKFQGRNTIEVIFASGRFYPRFANAGYQRLSQSDLTANMRFTFGADLPPTETYGLLEQMAIMNYISTQEIIDSKRGMGVLADGVANAMMFDGETKELLGGVSVYLEGKTPSSQFIDEQKRLEAANGMESLHSKS